MKSSASSFTLFEVSWEVCNKVGGIYTVLSTKAKTLVDRMGDDYIAVGPWLLSEAEHDIPFDEDARADSFAESCRDMGVPVRIGRWRIPGSPRTILVEFSRLYDQKDDVLSELWEDFGVDSISGSWDYVEPVLFGHAVGRVIEKWWQEKLAPQHKRAVVHAHEWMTGSSLLYVKQRVPALGTVFTTHATMLGRSLSSLGHSPEDGLGDSTAEQLAEDNGVVAKHSIEGVCAREADTFCTVSEITAREAELLHRRAPEPVTPNGIDLDVVDALAGDSSREQARTALHHVASRFFGEDLNDAAYLAVSGRYEFHNKGIDVLLEALARLNEQEGRRIVLFVLVPAGNSGVRSEFLERAEKPLDEIDGPLGISTHNLFDAEQDPVHISCAELGLDNAPDARVRVLQIPIYLEADDGFLNLPYGAVVRAMDLTCFPSYYEPWGYTPQESLAFGIPTVTSDYAGFGRWVRESNLGPDDGVTVLDRVHVQYDDVVGALATVIDGFLTDARSASELREACRATAARTSWSGFIQHYDEAYAAAAARVQERMKSGVLQSRRPPTQLKVRSTQEAQRPRLFSFEVSATLPEELAGLHRLARNMWWCWDPDAPALFAELSPLAWEACGHNPVSFLQRVYPEDLKDRAADRAYVARLKRVLERFDAYMAEPVARSRWSRAIADDAAAGAEPQQRPSAEHPVAYFCAEYGVHESLRIYSGGLGILAGDHVKSASDLNMPLVAIGLFYRMGYMSQRLSPTGEQVAADVENDPRSLPLERVLDASGHPLEITLQLPSRELHLCAWRLRVGRAQLYLLDANIPSNLPEDREITRNLYGGETETRLQQEIILGRGGVRLLRQLGITPSVYHMNEGHAAFLTLERVGQLAHKEGLTFEEARSFVRSTTLFTTHTPVPAGHDRFDEDLLRRYFSDVPDWVGVPWERFVAFGRAEGGDDLFNMTYLAMNFASFWNGVSELHGTVSQGLLRPLWPSLLEREVPVASITNGIHLPTWTHPEIAHALGATERPPTGDDFSRVPAKVMPTLWRAKEERKRNLLDQVRTRIRGGFVTRGDSPLLMNRALEGLRDDALYIGFARRFAPYKRAHLLFQDPERLLKLLNDAERPLRILVAGKAHPRDDHGRDILRGIVERTRSDDFVGKLFFVEDYDIDLARHLVQGVDVWLNNPTRMLEASGTSGMKAAANGTLNLSIGDGWWPEAYDGENGWLIGDIRVYEDQELQDQFDGSVLYRLLEEEILPLYFTRDGSGVPKQWLERMRRNLATIPATFNTDRMVLEYYRRAYGPLSGAFAELSENRKWKLKARAQEEQRIRKAFGAIKIVSASVGDVDSVSVGDPIDVRVEVDLGSLAADDVAVELVVGHSRGGDDLEQPLAIALPYVQTKGDMHVFEGGHRVDRSGSFSYGIRVRARTDGLDAGALRRLVVWA